MICIDEEIIKEFEDINSFLSFINRAKNIPANRKLRFAVVINEKIAIYHKTDTGKLIIRRL